MFFSVGSAKAVEIVSFNAASSEAYVGALTVNFLNTGLLFYALQVHFVQLFTSVLLVVVIVFQTMSRIFDQYQTRKAFLESVDQRRKNLIAKRDNSLQKS
jgi:DNA integrity scanning protein DisA with diadenylate cyclase activity